MNAARFGVLSALAASLCCVGPVVLVLLGLGSLGLGAMLGRYHWYFLLAALVLLALAWRSYLQERRRCQRAGCQMARAGLTSGALTIASMVVAAFVGLNLATYAGQQRSPRASASTGTAGVLAHVTLPVEGMTCFACQLAVESGLRKLAGVHEARADVTRRQATVRYDPRRVTVPQLIEAINATGYRAQPPPERGDAP